MSTVSPQMRALFARGLVAGLVVLACALHPTLASAQRTYVVREGDTLARVARRHRTTVTAIREANGMRGDRLRPGEELVVPRPGEEVPARAARRAGSRADRARAARLGLGTLRAGQSLLVRAPQRRWIAAAGSGRVAGTLRLPVDRGRLIRGWGSGAGGYHLAIDIRGRVGATIRAAERGIVAYSGDAVPGYGNFVILVHPNGWVTAYAHNRENLVVAGQLVTRGQAIARLGNTGRSQAPHLHFVFVDGGGHCDAAPLFDPPIARGPRAVWQGERPPEVQCARRSERPHPRHDPDEPEIVAEAEPEEPGPEVEPGAETEAAE